MSLRLDLQIGDEDGADDGAREIADAADKGHQDDAARLGGAHLRGGHDLEIDGRQAAGDAGEQAGQAEKAMKRTAAVL